MVITCRQSCVEHWVKGFFAEKGRFREARLAAYEPAHHGENDVSRSTIFKKFADGQQRCEVKYAPKNIRKLFKVAIDLTRHYGRDLTIVFEAAADCVGGLHHRAEEFQDARLERRHVEGLCRELFEKVGAQMSPAEVNRITIFAVEPMKSTYH